MANEQIEVEIVLDDGSIRKGFTKIEKEAQKTEGRLSKIFGVAKGFGKLAATATAAGAAIAGVVGVKGVAAAREQENAVNALATALGKVGEAARLSELEEFAAELQKTTRFGDEAVISQLAFAQAMGASVDQSKDILTAAADMSAALNIDLNSAVRNITKTLGGYAGELGEVIPELKALTQEQLQNGEGVALLAQKYQGFAQAEIKTFGGAVDQLSNSFGDLLEGIGDFLVQSPTFVKIINALSSGFGSLADQLKSARTGDFLQGLAQGAIDFARIWAQFVLTPIEVVVNAVNASVPIITAAFDKIKNAIQPTVDAISGLLDRIFGSVGEALEGAKITIEESDSPFAKIFETETADMFIAKLGEASFALQDFTAQRKLASVEVAEAAAVVEESTSLSFANIAASLKDAAKDIKITSKSIARSLITNVASGAGNAFAAFGKALATGENALEAFLNSLISSMGQMAIQLGTQFILQGAAYTWAGLPNGPALMAAGAALAVFGGVLSAVGGGTASVGAAGAQPVAEVGEPDLGLETTDEEVQEIAQTTGVTINVEGTVVDPASTGQTIAESLQEFFDQSGGQLVVNT